MIVTLDVSAAIEVVMGRPKQKSIINVLEKADWIIAPTLYIYEATNVMWKYNKFSNFPMDDLLDKIRHTLEIIDEYVRGEDIYEEAISLACKLNHSAYDAMYLVTSRRKNGTLVTLDSRLIKAANKIDILVTSI